MAQQPWQPVGPEAASPPSRKVALSGSAIALGCWGLAVFSSAAWLLTRPPCLPRYVRLIDLGWVSLTIATVGAVVTLAIFLVARRSGRHPVLAWVCWVPLVVALPVALFATGSFLADLGNSYDSTCWTF